MCSGQTCEIQRWLMSDEGQRQLYRIKQLGYEAWWWKCYSVGGALCWLWMLLFNYASYQECLMII